jgi:hypothetical protein
VVSPLKRKYPDPKDPGRKEPGHVDVIESTAEEVVRVFTNHPVDPFEPPNSVYIVPKGTPIESIEGIARNIPGPPLTVGSLYKERRK